MKIINETVLNSAYKSDKSRESKVWESFGVALSSNNKFRISIWFFLESRLTDVLKSKKKKIKFLGYTATNIKNRRKTQLEAIIKFVQST